jgi:putative ABC transport system permease protein
MISAARLAWLQLRREKVRLAVALAGVVFAVILVFMQLGFMDALLRTAVNVHHQLRADLVLVHRDYAVLPRVTRFARRRLYQALGFDGVASVSPLHTGVARWKNPENGRLRELFVMAVDPARPALAIPGVADALDDVRYPDRILFDRFSRPEFGPVPALLEAEQEVVSEVNLHKVTVRGLFALGTSFGVDGSIVTSDLTFRHIFPTYPAGAVSIGLIRLEPGADPAAVRDALAARLDRDVRVMTLQEFIDWEVAFWGTSTPIGFVFTFGVVMGLVVGVIIVYQILFADIADHLAEYATLKAMGYTNRYLAAVVLMQATILAVVGFVPGLLAAWRLYGLTRETTMLSMNLAPLRMAFVLGLTVVMCWASGLIAMRKLRSAQPAEIF